jgi:hypothetical protein
MRSRCLLALKSVADFVADGKSTTPEESLIKFSIYYGHSSDDHAVDM